MTAGTGCGPLLADVDRTEVIDEVLAPDDFSAGRIEALELALRRLDENLAAVRDGRAARSDAEAVLVRREDLRAPQLLAGRRISRVGDFHASLVVEMEDAPAAQHRRGKAPANGHFPDDLRLGRKGRWQG